MNQLRIKDSVDLKDLEELGFTSKNNNSYLSIDENLYIHICICWKSRYINIEIEEDGEPLGDYIVIGEIGILFDLIQAGLVEQVKE